MAIERLIAMSKGRLYPLSLCLREVAKVCALAGVMVLAAGHAGFAQIGDGAVQSLEKSCKSGSTSGTCYVWLSSLQPSPIDPGDLDTLKTDLTLDGYTGWPVGIAKSYVLSSQYYTHYGVYFDKKYTFPTGNTSSAVGAVFTMTWLGALAPPPAKTAWIQTVTTTFSGSHLDGPPTSLPLYRYYPFNNSENLINFEDSPWSR